VRSASWPSVVVPLLFPALNVPLAAPGAFPSAAAARDDRCVTGVDAGSIYLTTRTSARLRIFRGEPDQGRGAGVGAREAGIKSAA
jgi:hypothetical protein